MRPSLGSIVPGWVLVTPKRPLLNTAQLSPAEANDLKSFIQQVRNDVEEALGRRACLSMVPKQSVPRPGAAWITPTSTLFRFHSRGFSVKSAGLFRGLPLHSIYPLKLTSAPASTFGSPIGNELMLRTQASRYRNSLGVPLHVSAEFRTHGTIGQLRSTSILRRRSRL